MIKYFLFIPILIATIFSFSEVKQVQAATTYTKAPFEISGWLPYWRKATSTKDALEHINTFTEINPFGYTIKQDGTLFDAAGLTEEPWTTLIAKAKEKKIRVIPTVMTANTTLVHNLLSNAKSRKAHIKNIVDMVNKGGFDGVDIDYEGKKASTRPYFSLFLKELSAALGKTKWLMCSIESRTPLADRYDTIPKDIEYANDFVAINKYCDRVRIMAYDQGTIDLRLNEKHDGPYIPVADTVWVEKVVKEAAKTISKSKIVIGVATYGYEYELKKLSEYGYRYTLQWAFNPRYAIELASSFGIIPERNVAGELSFIYTPTSTTATSKSGNIEPIDQYNRPIDGAVIGQAAVSQNITPNLPHIVWWSDAKAIAEKVALAKKLGVRGVAVFKIDGGEDPNMWSILK